MRRGGAQAALAADGGAATCDGAPVVVDGALDQAACAEACAAALAFFDGAGDRRIAEQALHRGDDVAFVPLFGEDLCGNQI